VVALTGISTEKLAEALCTVYLRGGIPTHVVHDQGSQFMSDVMAEVSRLLFIRNLVSTPYHPQTNGFVECFNDTLKAMIKNLCIKRPKDWDRYLESVLFAYREVKQESTGFSRWNSCTGVLSVDRWQYYENYGLKNNQQMKSVQLINTY